jgi:WD40 repeat protein
MLCFLKLNTLLLKTLLRCSQPHVIINNYEDSSTHPLPTLRYKKMKCHDQVTIGCQWHPIEASRFATCSWDGTIKYWD